MTEQDFETYKHSSVNIVPETNNQISFAGFANHPNVTFALVGAAGSVTEIRVSNTDDFDSATVKAWVFPTAVNGVCNINVAGFSWKYIWFVGGVSANTILGTVYAFTMSRKPPANNATVAALVA